MTAGVDAASVPEAGLTLILTVGLSSSVMLKAWLVVAPKVMQEEAVEIVKIAFSVPSNSASLFTVNVAVPVVCPLKIVMEAGKPVKSAAVAVPEIPRDNV